jgi:hypothetical protein
MSKSYSYFHYKMKKKTWKGWSTVAHTGLRKEETGHLKESGETQSMPKGLHFSSKEKSEIMSVSCNWPSAAMCVSMLAVIHKVLAPTFKF